MESTSFLSKRNIGLDFLRAILILEGVLYHAARSLPGGNSWYYVAEKNESIGFSSLIEFVHAFRMEAFFFLSGMFSAMIVLRKGTAFFVDNRKKRVLLPLIGSFLFIPPLMYLISSVIKGTPMDTAGLMGSWGYLHHLWFLVSLSIMSLIIPVKVSEKLSQMLRGVPFPLAIIGIIGVCNFFFVVKYVLKDTGELISLLPVTARFFIYYVAGYALYVNRDKIPELRKHFLVSNWVIIPLAAITYAAFYYTQYAHLEGVIKYIPTLIASVFSVVFSFWLVFFFEKMSMKENNLVKLVVDSALVVYLMHYPVVIFLSYAFDPYLPVDAPLSYVALITCTSLLVSVVLYYGVKRSKILSTVFGLKPATAKAATVAPPVDSRGA